MLDLRSLTTYLNDHLAGAEAAIALLEKLESHELDELDVAGLRREITADHRVVADLLEAWGTGPSGLKRAAGWLAEKLSRPKLSDEPLGRLEALELLSLGILGKRALWRSLAAVRTDDPRLDALPLEELEARAEAQYALVERARLACAVRAFQGSETPTPRHHRTS